MEFIRGTTPTIEIKVRNEIDLSNITVMWLYISQSNKVKVDKNLSDVQIDYDKRIIYLRLEQEDTLNLKAGEALFQIKVRFADTNVLATMETKVKVYEAYKPGVIE